MTFHCIIHQEALSTQAFHEELGQVMDFVLKIVNTIEAVKPYFCQMKEDSDSAGQFIEMNSEYSDLRVLNKCYGFRKVI